MYTLDFVVWPSRSVLPGDFFKFVRFDSKFMVFAGFSAGSEMWPLNNTEGQYYPAMFLNLRNLIVNLWFSPGTLPTLWGGKGVIHKVSITHRCFKLAKFDCKFMIFTGFTSSFLVM
jgi:hypothetical protein